MAFIKEESEDIRIAEVFSIKHEDTEEQTDLKVLKEESQELNENEDKYLVEENPDFKTEEKHFSCSLTKKTSTRIRAQKTGTRGISCKHCGKKFTHNGKLKKHIRIHTGEKPYACTQCGKSFIEKGNLEKHMTVPVVYKVPESHTQVKVQISYQKMTGRIITESFIQLICSISKHHCSKRHKTVL